MTVLTQPLVGTFCWAELATTNDDSARAFYAGLFGWSFTGDEGGEVGQYRMAQLSGRNVGALHQMTEKFYPAGTPAHWTGYIAVANADETAQRITEAGGQLLAGPFDVEEHGRMVLALDPIGATFAVWQAKSHIGAEVIGEPGALGWFQLNASDQSKAEAFYTKAIGWTTQRDPMAMGGEYTTFLQSGMPVAGGMPMPPGVGAPSHWLAYFSVADVDAAHAKAASLGANTHVPPMDIPGVARFAVLADPQGATFAIVKFSM